MEKVDLLEMNLFSKSNHSVLCLFDYCWRFLKL